MNRKNIIQILVGAIAVTGLSTGFAQQGPRIQCPDCLVNYTTAQDLADAISDNVGVEPDEVMVIPADVPGRFQVSLPDGSHFSVAPVGLTFRHQNMVQRRLSVTDDGGLHLRSQTRKELQLRSAVHREDAVVAELLRLGWTNFHWAGYGMEVDAPDETRYCFQPDMRIFVQSAPAGISVTQDADGNLVVLHPDGIRQRLHACAHDPQQLRDQVRAQVNQPLLIDTDGTLSITMGGNTVRYRLRAELRWTGVLDQPGFYHVGSRFFFRYRDGWEQEIMQVAD